MLKMYNVNLPERRTSIRLEPEIWDALQDIARRESVNVHDICSAVSRGHRSPSLTAAVRAFALQYYRRQWSVGGWPGLTGAPGPGGGWRHDSRILSTPFESEGSDFNRWTLWRTDALDRTPRRGMFLPFWQWTDCRRQLGRVPTLTEMLEGPLGEELERQRANLIDVRPEDPGQYVFDRLAASSIFGPAPRLVGAMEFKPHARSLILDATAVKTSGVPRVASVSQRYGGINRAYVRLALPLADETGRVARIAAVVRGLRTFPSIYNEGIFGLSLPIGEERSADQAA
ncbi:MAG: ribbon-helix-helix domain-containing protein [Alphaproteobacteria bacterium]